MVSPSSTNPKVTDQGDMIFRTCFTDPFQAHVCAEFAAGMKHWKTAALLVDQQQAYAVGMADYFEKDFKQMGGTIAIKQQYNTGDQDFSATLTAYAGPGDFDASFAGGYVMTPLQSMSEADAVFIDAKGRAVVAGFSFEDDLAHMVPTLVRYLPDGSVDGSFGNGPDGVTFVTPPGGLTEQANFCCVKFDSKHETTGGHFSCVVVRLPSCCGFTGLKRRPGETQ